MGNDRARLDFAELLDELLAASAEDDDDADGNLSSPSLRVDLLDQIERLQPHGRPLFTGPAMDEYRRNAAGHATPPPPGAAQPATPDLQPALDDLFFLDPQSISRELGIVENSRPADLDRARRSFAMRYHPDRVPEEMRERAALRMQIANMLIDEAKRGKR